MQAVAHLLRLLVEQLLWHFFPCKAQIARHRHQPQADCAPRRKNQGAGITVGASLAIGLLRQKLADRFVREVAGGDDVRQRRAGQPSHSAALGQVNLQKSAMLTAELAERVDRLDYARAFCPAAALRPQPASLRPRLPRAEPAAQPLSEQDPQHRSGLATSPALRRGCRCLAGRRFCASPMRPLCRSARICSCWMRSKPNSFSIVSRL